MIPVIEKSDNKSLVSLKKRVLSLVNSTFGDWPEYEAITNEIEDFLSYHPTPRIPVLEEVKETEKGFRTKNLLFAHFYTSEKYPWPKIDGNALFPIIQFDIAAIQKLSTLSNVRSDFPYKDGLLQVWAGNAKHPHGDGYVRIIPAGEFDIRSVTYDVPELDEDSIPGVYPFKGFGFNGGRGAIIKRWKIGAPCVSYSPDLRVINELNEKFVALRRIERDKLEVEVKKLKLTKIEQRRYIEDNLDSRYNSKRHDAVDSFGDRLMDILHKSRSCSRGGAHLFGVSVGGQKSMGWSKLPWECLFQLDQMGGGDFEISICGTAILQWNGSNFVFDISLAG